MSDIKNNVFKVVEKAWTIDWDKIEEGFYYEGNINVVYAESRSKARGKFYADTDICDYKLRGGIDIEFINIPFKRCEYSDKYDYGERFGVLTYEQYLRRKQKLEHKTNLDEIMNNKDVTHCYIMKRGEYSRSGFCGYTSRKSIAGAYTKEEAVNHARNILDINILPINVIEHNELIRSEIKILESKIIYHEH